MPFLYGFETIQAIAQAIHRLPVYIDNDYEPCYPVLSQLC